MFLLIHMSINSYFKYLCSRELELVAVGKLKSYKYFVDVVALHLCIYFLPDLITVSTAASLLYQSDVSLRRLGVHVYFTLLREDRKGLSLGTDILWWDTPCSHRQDLIFAFLPRGREGKQRLLTSTATNGWRG